MLPEDIERKSFEIIERELPHALDETLAPVIKRVIHTTADFDYADTLRFSPDAMESAFAAIGRGCTIVTDTTMVAAGINKRVLKRLGGNVCCFVADDDVVENAGKEGTTRSVQAVKKASRITGDVIFAVGNAPTALFEICHLIEEGELHPGLVIGVPVGFVNVEASKEKLTAMNVPYIAAMGRKGGSNVAAAICNALLYLYDQKEQKPS